MGAREKSVWDRWLICNAERYERIGVNVPLWFNAPLPHQQMDFAGIKSSLKPEYRVDAVVGRGDVVRIIEVKSVANLMSIGQLLTYEILFTRTYHGFVLLDKLLVCGKISNTLKYVCKELGISFDVV